MTEAEEAICIVGHALEELLPQEALKNEYISGFGSDGCVGMHNYVPLDSVITGFRLCGSRLFNSCNFRYIELANPDNMLEAAKMVERCCTCMRLHREVFRNGGFKDCACRDLNEEKKDE
jgi:hypothetical protein